MNASTENTLDDMFEFERLATRSVAEVDGICCSIVA